MSLLFKVGFEVTIVLRRIVRSLIGISLTYLWTYHNEKLYYWN